MSRWLDSQFKESASDGSNANFNHVINEETSTMGKITYFLPPYPTSPRATLLSAIEFLSNEGVDETTFLLLAAIAQSIIWSEECHIKFLDIGFKAALEIYDASAQNADFYEVQKDPGNPRNWNGYIEFLKRHNYQ